MHEQENHPRVRSAIRGLNMNPGLLGGKTLG